MYSILTHAHLLPTCAKEKEQKIKVKQNGRSRKLHELDGRNGGKQKKRERVNENDQY